MEFNIDLNNFFKSDIVIITNSLMPEPYAGDYHHSRYCQQTVSVILDEMGEASAKAQGLLKPVTSADRLRNSDHIVYLLIEKDTNKGKGSVVGLLKMGRKNLYVFDEYGDCHNQISFCVLDFYVHESRQRMGYGKALFEYMLKRENVEPVKLAIDRPSEKFLSFLKKHYGLEKAIHQTNNFVVFSGFFHNTKNRSYADESLQSSDVSFRNSLDDSVTYNGRFTAHKRESTIGKIIHSSPVT